MESLSSARDYSDHKILKKLIQENSILEFPLHNFLCKLELKSDFKGNDVCEAINNIDWKFSRRS